MKFDWPMKWDRVCEIPINTHDYTPAVNHNLWKKRAVFRTIIPLNEVATVGPSLTGQNDEVGGEEGMTALSEIKLDRKQLKRLLVYCGTSRSRKELQEYSVIM